MGKIKVSSCETDGMVIEGLHVIEPTVFNDERGYFMETYNQRDMESLGFQRKAFCISMTVWWKSTGA